VEASTSLASLILCTGAILALLIYGVKVVVNRRDKLGALVLGLTLVHECVLVLSPVWYSVMTDFRLENQMLNNVTSSGLAITMLGETLYVALFLAGLLYGANGPSASRRVGDCRRTDPREVATLAVIVLLGLWISVDLLTRPVLTLTEVGGHAELRSYSTLHEMVEAWCIGSFYQPAIFAACLLLLVRRVRLPWRAAAVALLLSVVVYGLVTGLRGRITWVLFAGFALAALFGKRKALVVMAASFVALAPLLAPLGDGAYRFSLNASLSRLPQTQVVPILLDHLSSRASASSLLQSLDSLMDRAMGPRNSVTLFQLYDEGAGASYRPILSALVFPIPRSLWNGKPPAGSSDETPYGAAMYRVMTRGHGSPYYNMGPFLASAHAYWEGGWPWLVLAALASGLIWRIILRWCYAQSLAFGALIAMAFASSLLIDGFYTAFVPTYSLLRAFWQSCLPLVCLRWAVAKALHHPSLRSQLSLAQASITSFCVAAPKRGF
jgi:hypothetical protein